MADYDHVIQFGMFRSGVRAKRNDWYVKLDKVYQAEFSGGAGQPSEQNAREFVLALENRLWQEGKSVSVWED